MPTTREKIGEVMNGIQLAALATTTPRGAPKVRYVMVAADQDLTMRVATFLRSSKVEQIRANPGVHLLCGVTSPEKAWHWIQVDGQAEIRTDDDERKAIWFDALEKYFSGPDDPNLGVIRISPARIAYHRMESREPEIWEPGP